MQGGAAIVTATVYAPAMCHRASASNSDAAAIATVQALPCVTVPLPLCRRLPYTILEYELLAAGLGV